MVRSADHNDCYVALWCPRLWWLLVVNFLFIIPNLWLKGLSIIGWLVNKTCFTVVSDLLSEGRRLVIVIVLVCIVLIFSDTTFIWYGLSSFVCKLYVTIRLYIPWKVSTMWWLWKEPFNVVDFGQVYLSYASNEGRKYVVIPKHIVEDYFLSH